MVTILIQSIGKIGKKKQPFMSPKLNDITFGMILSDAGMSRRSNEALIKFEQGYQQKDFIDHLFDIYKPYCFMESTGKRYDSNGNIKSYWFKTFSHKTFSHF